MSYLPHVLPYSAKELQPPEYQVQILSSSWHVLVTLSCIVAITMVGVSSSQVCSPGSFPYPELLGIEITSLSAYERHNHSINLPLGGIINDLEFCNVNQYLLLNFASVALNDMASLGEAITESQRSDS